ncbi:MAG TPA: hypothetical protein VM433_12070 [Mycobacteriales bacterium]|nr:hypothetical protein [Mycobacteriales bacterium]
MAQGSEGRYVLRRLGAAGLALACLVGLGVAAIAAAPTTLPLLSAPCSVTTGDGEIGLSREKARSVTTLAAVAVRDGVPAGQLDAAVAAVLAGPDDVLPLAEAPARLDAPSPVAPDVDSAAVAAAVLGQAQGAMACRTSPAPSSGESEGDSGLTPRAERLRAEMEGAFGPQSLGGFAPGGVRDGHIEGSAHYEGRAIDVFFRPVTPESTARGWALSHWLVAHADELDLAVVIFDRQLWSARRSDAGWRPYRHPSGDMDNPVLAHEDHVHVDVAR